MRNIATLVLSIALLSLIPRAAIACSCTLPDDAPTSLGESTLVVAAEAMSVSQESTPIQRNGREFTVSTEIVQWEVGESWKGPYSQDQRFSTRTPVRVGMCGRPVREGEVLLLYLSGPEPYQISMCSRTSQLKRLLKDVPLLYRLSGKVPDGP